MLTTQDGLETAGPSRVAGAAAPVEGMIHIDIYIYILREREIDRYVYIHTYIYIYIYTHTQACAKSGRAGGGGIAPRDARIAELERGGREVNI